ncbi:hypothetical protein [Streptomyces goshikiensis]|uniref:hypothetical protein n=1 Tax=Streptomyces goshikiensis TaxID=1942 RepID=UPI00364CAD23
MRGKTHDPVLDKTAQAATQGWDSATRVGQYAADKTPDLLLEKAGQAVTVARQARPAPIAGDAIIMPVLVRRSRRRSR